MVSDLPSVPVCHAGRVRAPVCGVGGKRIRAPGPRPGQQWETASVLGLRCPARRALWGSLASPGAGCGGGGLPSRNPHLPLSSLGALRLSTRPRAWSADSHGLPVGGSGTARPPNTLGNTIRGTRLPPEPVPPGGWALRPQPRGKRSSTRSLPPFPGDGRRLDVSVENQRGARCGVLRGRAVLEGEAPRPPAALAEARGCV